MKNPITSIIILVLLFLSAVVGAFFAGKASGKREVPVTRDSLIYITQYKDTCFPVQIDSMEIYRTVRKGLMKKVKTKKVNEVIVSADTVESVVSYTDKHIDLETKILHTGELVAVEHEITLDTPYIIQNVYITDTVPVYTDPIIIEHTTEKTVEIPVERSAFGAKLGTGTVWDDPLQGFAVNVGLFYQDKKRRMYSIDVGTDKRIQAHFFVPIFK